MLKKMMIGAGLAAIVASTAMAQSYQPEVGSGNIVPNTNQEQSRTLKSGSDAFAYERTAPHQHHHSMHSWDRD